MTQQIFYYLDVSSHLHEQAAACMAQRVRCYLWIVDTDNAQSHLHYLRDCCFQEACLWSPNAMVYNQWIVLLEVSLGNVVLVEFHCHLWQCHHITLVEVSFALDV